MNLNKQRTLALLAVVALAALAVRPARALLRRHPSDGERYQLSVPTAPTCMSGPASPIFNSSHNQLLLALYYNASSAATRQERADAAEDERQQRACEQTQTQRQKMQRREESLVDENQLRQELEMVAKAKSLITKGFGRDEDEAPLITSSFNTEDDRHLAAAYLSLYKLHTLGGVLSVAEWLRMGLIALTEASVYHTIYLHRYDNYEDLRRAAGPAVNNDLCVAQLASLAERSARQEREKYFSRDSNLYGLLDTWGHLNSGVFTGRLFQDGVYSECTRYKIRELPSESERARGHIMSSRAPIETRYCVLSVSHKSWQRADKHDILNMKWSVCIPKSCDSSNYKNKFELIGRIAQSQARRMEEGEFRINNMYCLPDEDSPLRSVRNSPRALAALGFFGSWLLFLLFATYKYDKLKKIVNEGDSKAAAAAEQGFGLTNMNMTDDETNGTESDSTSAAAAAAAASDKLEAQRARLKIYKLFSITNNLKLLFDTTKESSLVESSRTATSQAKAEEQQAAGQQAKQREVKFVDLRCLEGIKVIAMAYVIMGHVLMCMPAILANGRELADTSSPAFFLANLVPAFAVNSFFTITGILTCYLMFKQNKSQPVIGSPGKWVAFIVYRYLRIMPMYALVVLYCKTLAKYTGSGPFWDYATSSLGQRAACEQEPWHWTLLFISNFLPPMQHCIPGGWYLSNDFQFFLVTPLLVIALERSPRWGKILLKTLIVVGYSLGFYSIYSSPVVDLRPISRFMPHGFKTYVSHFSFNYTYPQYRIPAYLIGLLVGYKLFQYEEDKKQFLERKRQLEATSPQEAASLTPPDWPEEFKRRAALWSALLVGLCCAVPFLGSNLRPNLAVARTLVSFITPTCHIQFSAAVGMYIMLATTGNGNKYVSRFLSASFWKPLARLSLCAVLVNVEVINYITQTSTSQNYVSNQYHMMLNMICISCTYVVATVVCVLFEAPVRAGLNAILTHAIAKVARKQKAD